MACIINCAVPARNFGRAPLRSLPVGHMSDVGIDVTRPPRGRWYQHAGMKLRIRRGGDGETGGFLTRTGVLVRGSGSNISLTPHPYHPLVTISVPLYVKCAPYGSTLR